MPLVSIAPWFGSELAIVADSGLWDGHGIALVGGNRYKGESRNAAILHSTKNAPGPKSRGMKFKYQDSYGFNAAIGITKTPLGLR